MDNKEAFASALLQSANVIQASLARGESLNELSLKVERQMVDLESLNEAKRALMRAKLTGAALDVALEKKRVTEQELEQLGNIAKKLAITTALVALGV